MLEYRSIENSAPADCVGFQPDHVVFEQCEEQVSEQRVEMRDQAASRLDQLADLRRAETDLVPGPPIIAVALYPERPGGDRRDVQTLGFYRLFRHRRSSLDSNDAGCFQ